MVSLWRMGDAFRRSESGSLLRAFCCEVPQRLDRPTFPAERSMRVSRRGSNKAPWIGANRPTVK